MTPLPDFLKPLEYLAKPFPEQAVREALERREESVPHLIAGIGRSVGEGDDLNEKFPDFMLHEYALFILAQLREERAYEVIVRLARHPEVDFLVGDTLTESLPGILASVSGRDPGRIQELVEDRAADEFARSSGIRALVAMADQGWVKPEELSAYFGELFGRLERRPQPVWDNLIIACADLRLMEHLEAVRALHRDGIADPMVDSLEHAEARMTRPAGTPTGLKDRARDPLIDDAAGMMRRWICFREEPRRPVPPVAPRPSLAPARTGPKVGRNEPCPCGSGKKFKKCCG